MSRKFLEMNLQRVAGLVLQTICGLDDGFFAEDLGNDVGQWVKDGAINSRLLHCDLFKSECGTISDKARLNSTTFKINDPVDQWFELFTLLCRDADNISSLDTNHASFGAVCGRREVVENGVNLVTLADPNVREIGE